MGERPVRVGLIGAGPWARSVTGPVLAAGPETEVTGVWSRTPAHAQAVADALGVPRLANVDALLDTCEAVAIAVSPEAQPELAIRAAAAGRPMLLEKPLALDVPTAAQVVDALRGAGVPSLMMLTYRFHPGFDAFVELASRFEVLGARGCFLSGAFLPGSPYAYGWRMDRGALLDVGPHLIDLHEAALGEVVDLHANGDVRGWVSMTLVHASRVTSQAAVCCSCAIDSRTELELFGPSGTLLFDGREGERHQIGDGMRAAFARVARGEHHPADAARGLHVQELVARAEAQLRGDATSR